MTSSVLGTPNGPLPPEPTRTTEPPTKAIYLLQEDFPIAIPVDFFEEVGRHFTIPYEHVPLRKARHKLQQFDVKH